MRILVAVADVDAVVREGSAIDGHARTNTTSVYTAAEIFPLLPEKLSLAHSSNDPSAMGGTGTIEPAHHSKTGSLSRLISSMPKGGGTLWLRTRKPIALFNDSDVSHVDAAQPS